MAMARSERAEFLALIADLQQRVAALEKNKQDPEPKRGPGRPPKAKDATETAD